jgi:lipopolysaccharide transport protein LptA/LPS export ABC transporter protein LptC
VGSELMSAGADSAGLPQPGASVGAGLVLAGDRTQAFRQARRGSKIVRTLRWALPISSVALLLGYAVVLLSAQDWSAEIAELAARKILPTDLVMKNPNYEGFGKDGSSYAFQAKTASQNLKNVDLIELKGITGWVRQADKTKTDITAVRGLFDHKKNVLELFENIDIASESGLKARLTQALILTKESLIISREPVAVSFPSGDIRSKSMTLRQKAREVTFTDEVVAHLKPPPRSEGEAAKPAKKAGATTGMFSASDAPIDISSDRLEVNDVTKTAIFYGNVEAVQGEATMKSPELEVTYDGGTFGTTSKADGEQPSSKLSSIIARGPVEMTRGEVEKVTSERAEFDAEHEQAVLTGNVVMSSGADRLATSDRADLDQSADTALLTGSVHVVQQRNELTGRRLFIDRANGRARLTAPPGMGEGPGRVTARLYQGTKAKTPGKKASASKKQNAGPSPVGAFRTDPTAPVDIDADQLDIDERSQVAVFRGDVHAKQGDFKIVSAELHAFYRGGAGLADVTGGKKNGKGKSKATELTRIEAKRNVVVTTKDGRRVEGDWATFDTKKNKIVVGGDVILTQKKNKVRGTRLVIDIATGRSTIDTAPEQTVSAPSGGGWSTAVPGQLAPENSGRASAVFFPQQLKKTPKPKPGGASVGSAMPPESWGITTTPGAP